jgi:hypothetical protein
MRSRISRPRYAPESLERRIALTCIAPAAQVFVIVKDCPPTFPPYDPTFPPSPTGLPPVPPPTQPGGPSDPC